MKASVDMLLKGAVMTPVAKDKFELFYSLGVTLHDQKVWEMSFHAFKEVSSHPTPPAVHAVSLQSQALRVCESNALDPLQAASQVLSANRECEWCF